MNIVRAAEFAQPGRSCPVLSARQRLLVRQNCGKARGKFWSGLCYEVCQNIVTSFFGLHQLPTLATNALTTANAAAKPAATANNYAPNNGVDNSPFAAMLAVPQPQSQSQSQPQPKTEDAPKRDDSRAGDTTSSDAKDAKAADARSADTRAINIKSADARSDRIRADRRSAKADSSNNTDQTSGKAGIDNKDPAQPIVDAAKKDDNGKAAAPDSGAILPASHDSTAQPQSQPQQTDYAAVQAGLQAAVITAAVAPPAADSAGDSKIGVDAKIKAAANASAPRPTVTPNADPAAAKIPSQAKVQADTDTDGGATDVSGKPGQPVAIAPQAPKGTVNGDQPLSAKTDPAQIKDAPAKPDTATNTDKTATAGAQQIKDALARLGSIAGNDKSTSIPKDASQTKDAPASNVSAADNDKLKSAKNNAAPTKNDPTSQVSANNSDTPVSAKNDAPQSGEAPAGPKNDTNTQAAIPPAIPVPHVTQQTASEPVTLAATGINAPQPIAGNNAAPVTGSIHVGPQAPEVAPNVNSLAVEIAARSQSGAKEFNIRLDPPELGRVDVRLSIDATGKTEAHMTADQPQTLHLLQKDSETLTRALRDAGLDVSQNGLNFSLRGQDRHAGDGHNNSRGTAPSRMLEATKTIDAIPAGNITFSSAGDARLDIHV